MRVRSGFTMVEMLVVVAVLSVLVSLIVPCARFLRLRAHDMQCRNNLRNLYMGVQVYSQHWEGIAPRSLAYAEPAPGNGHARPGFEIFPSASAATLESDRTSYVSHYYKDSSLLTCPCSFTQPSYGLHRVLATIHCTLRDIERPAIIPLVFDSGVNLGSTYSDLAYRHDLQANGAFVDGHVQKVKFFPERAFPNIVLLPGPRTDPDDHSGIDASDFHEGSHPSDPEQQEEDTYEGNIETVQVVNRAYSDYIGETVEFTFENTSETAVTLTGFEMLFSRTAYYDYVMLDGDLIWSAAADNGGVYGASEGSVTHPSMTVEPGATFQVTVANFNANDSGTGIKMEMRPVNFEFRFSNGSIALSPGEEAEGDPDPFQYAILCDKMTLSGEGTIDVTGYPVHTNTTLSMSNTCTIKASIVTAGKEIKGSGSSGIYGDATSPQINFSSPIRVTGTATIAPVPRIELPDIDFSPYIAHAQANGEVRNGDVTITSPVTLQPVGGIMYINGNLLVDAEGTVLRGCFIVTGKIEMKKPCRHFKVASYPGFVSLTNDFKTTGGGQHTEGLIYVKDGEFNTTGGDMTTHTGSIMAKKDFKKSGTFQLTYADSTPTPPGAP